MKKLTKEFKRVWKRLEKLCKSGKLTYSDIEADISQYIWMVDRAFLDGEITKEKYLELIGLGEKLHTSIIVNIVKSRNKRNEKQG